MSNYDFRRINVLVCDDSYYIRTLVRTFLEGFGINQVIEVSDAREGFLTYIDEDPDLIITDWDMGETSGLDLVHLIRWSEKSPNPCVPIIMLSGYTELERIKQARDAGVSGYLAKPLTAAGLYKQLCATVDDRRPFIRDAEFFGPDRRVKFLPEFPGPDHRLAA